MSYKYLWFSGLRLYLVHGASTKSWLAVSGKPKGNGNTGLHFDYSKSSQAAKDFGPLPSGKYTSSTADIRTYQHTKTTYVSAALYAITELKSDYLTKMDNAWGKIDGLSGRIIPILNAEGGTDYSAGRNNCWIHGSNSPGSIGCIDLCDHMDAFIGALLDLQLDSRRPI